MMLETETNKNIQLKYWRTVGQRQSPAPSAAEASPKTEGAQGPTEEASQAAGKVSSEVALPPMTPSPHTMVQRSQIMETELLICNIIVNF